MINDNLTLFGERPVKDFDLKEGLKDPEGIAYRIRISWDEENRDIVSRIEELLADPNVNKLQALVIGSWTLDSSDTSESTVRALIAATDKLASLRELFLGDITYEECEISWLLQCDVGPLLAAFPELRVLRVRGADGLKFSCTQHTGLQELAFESGGLPSHVVQAVLQCNLPQLRRLEFWLGDAGYGFDGRPDMFDDLLSGRLFPQLQYLGLMSSEIADELAARVAQAPLLKRLHTLDMSMGIMTEKGANALAQSSLLSHVRMLHIQENYIPEESLPALRAIVPRGTFEPQKKATKENDGYRYVEHAE